MTIVARYLIGHYVRVFAFTLLAATAAFLVVDLADRVADYTEYRPSAASLFMFYVFHLPRMLADVYPAVSLLAVLLSLGLLARRREILALRACGMGPWQMSAPLLVASAAISFGAFVWNEMIVPPTAAEARRVRDVVIKKRDVGLLDARSIWLQGRNGFLNIDYFDAGHEKLHGLRLYVADEAFRLRRIVEVPVATWRDGAWHMASGTVKEFDATGRETRRPSRAGDIYLADAPSDLARRRPHAEELTLRALRDRIRALEARGLDAAELRVDLHAKFAMPLAGLISVLVGFPLAIRGGRRFGLAYNVSLGLITGFAYWVTMAVAVSAGRAGVVPPVLAAWSPNVIFATAGALMYASSER